MRREFLVLIVACNTPPTVAHEAPQATSVAPIASSSMPAASSSAPPTTLGPNVIEQATLDLDGVKEEWRLEWVGSAKAKDACFESFVTCPCAGFAYGQRGTFDIVRHRDGAPDERLRRDGQLQRWPTDPADAKRWSNQDPDKSIVKSRPAVHNIVFGDYDGDGRPSEFVLQVGTTPCVRTWSIVVGIDRANPHLHVFTAGSEPIVLPHREDWDKVRSAADTVPIELISCGDHGYNGREDYIVRKKPPLTVEQRSYDCAGKLLSKHPYKNDAFSEAFTLPRTP